MELLWDERILYEYKAIESSILNMSNQFIMEENYALEAEGTDTGKTSSADKSAEFDSSRINTNPNTDNKSTNTSDTEPKNDKIDMNAMKESKSIGEKLIALIKKLKGIIVRFIDSLNQYIKKAMVTDKGFEKQLDLYTRSYKPRNSIRIIMYEYTEINSLDKYGNGLLKAIKESINSFLTDNMGELPANSLLKMDKDILNKEILKLLGASDTVESLDEYYTSLKARARGKKKETTLTSNDSNMYVTRYRAFKKKIEVTNSTLESVKKDITSLDRKIRTMGRSEGISKESRQAYIKALNNITIMYNAYSTYNKMTFVLFTEERFQIREILKRFYDMV